MATELLLPQNIEAEAGVLGSLLIDGDGLAQVADFLPAEYFYREAHRTIYQAAYDLYAAGQPADLITLIDELARRGKLEEVGGAAYVSSLANQVPTSANIEHYARIVLRTALLRRLIHAAGQIAAIAYSDPDAEAALEASERLLEAVRGGDTSHEVRRLGASADAFAARLERIQEVRRRGEVLGVPSGFADQDRITGGFQRGDLVIVAGRPGVGKTSYGLSMVDAMAVKHQIPVGYFSLEMPEEQLLARLVSMHSGVDVQALHTGAFADDAWDAVLGALGVIGDAPIFVDDSPSITLARLRARARHMVRYDGVRAIFVDYLQLMDGSGAGAGADGHGGQGGGWRRQENRQQEVSEISRGLKALARDLGIPVIALAQLSRAVESRQDKHPQLSDLRESGALEQDSDVVIFLYRDEVYNPETDRPHIADVEIAKHRNGPTGRISLYFQASQTRYRDLEIHREEGLSGDRAGAVPANVTPWRQRAWDDADADDDEGGD